MDGTMGNGANAASKKHKYTVETVQQNGLTLEVKRFPKLTSGQVAYATVIAFFAWSFSTFDFVLEGTLLPLMAQEFGWSVAYSAQVAMYVSIGVLIVSFTVGPVAEKIGRSNALLVCTLGTCLASFLSGFTTGAAFLVFARLFSAYGYQEQVVNATYMNEITTNVKHKGFIYGFVQGGWPIGVMMGAVICALWLEDLGWRGMYWIATIPAIIIIIMRLKLKESPRYLEIKEVKKLMKEGKMDEAIALGDIYGIDVAKMNERTPIGQLFEPGLRLHTICLFAINILIWFPCQIFSVLGSTVLTDGKGVGFGSAMIMIIIVNGTAYLGYLLAGAIGDKVGRKWVILGIWVLSGLSFCFCMAIATSHNLVLFTYTLGTFCMLGGWATLMTYQGESYPTRIRALAVSTQNAVGYVGAIISSGIFSLFIGAFGTATAALLAGGIPTIIAGLLMLGCHTIKPGQQLEDIIQ